MFQFSARNRTICVLIMTGLTAGCSDPHRPVSSQPPGVTQGGSLELKKDQTEKQPVPGGVRPITDDRLAGAELTEIGREPRIVWNFTADRFELTIAGDPLPADLLDSLLGPGGQSRRIVGAWKLSADGQALQLSELEAQPLPTDRPESRAVLPVRVAEVSLPLAPAGWVRANLGERQYNILDRTQRRLSHEQALPGDGTVKLDATLPIVNGEASAGPIQSDTEGARSE